VVGRTAIVCAAAVGMGFDGVERGLWRSMGNVGLERLKGWVYWFGRLFSADGMAKGCWDSLDLLEE
jgi:hypothetical protein